MSDVRSARPLPRRATAGGARARPGPRYNRPYEDEPGVIEQFRPGECQARFEAKWDDESGNWIFGKRVDDA
jgi:hypothetical protein